MFKSVASALVFAVALAPSVLLAERTTGDIAGVVTDQLGQAHANYQVRARQMSLAGAVVAVGATTATGNFVLPDLAPGNDYVLEVLSTGAVVGTSRMVTVTAGKAASVRLTAMGGAPMAPAPRGVASFLLNPFLIGGVIAVAIAVPVFIATRDDASASS